MLVGLGAPGSGEMRLLVLLGPGALLAEVLELGLVVVASVALALAGRGRSEFVSPSLLVGTGHEDALGAGVRGDAAEIQRVLPPPLAPADGVGQEVRGLALARAQQLLHRLQAAARPVRQVPSGAHLPAAELAGICTQGTENSCLFPNSSRLFLPARRKHPPTPPCPVSLRCWWEGGTGWGNKGGFRGFFNPPLILLIIKSLVFLRAYFTSPYPPLILLVTKSLVPPSQACFALGVFFSCLVSARKPLEVYELR